MAGESSQILETIQPAITLLGLGIVAALVSRACRLSPIVGYLGLGLGLAALGLADDFSGPVVATLAEAGVMFLLFNLGLHFSLGRIKAEAANIFGFGTLQMVVAGGGFTALFLLFGLPTEFAIIGGFALGLSSTAVVIGLVRERDQEDCPVGRAAQSILIFQDIAAILLLVAAGSLGSGGALAPALGLAGLKALAAFGIAVLFGRYLTGRLFRLIARVGSSEVYTATALFIALAAGWATGMAGLSLTLGAFLGGMAVADSRYRIMVQTEIDAFRGLFLSFFFISVGLSIDPGLLAENWLWVILAAVGMIALKCLFNVIAGLANRWSVPGSIQLGFLLGQGSEFALVIFALPAVAGLVEPRLISIMVTAIAISLAVTPAISNIGRKLAGKLRAGPPDKKLAGDDAPVVIIGLGPAGRAVADALSYNDIGYLAVEPNPERFEIAVADGYHVHQANPADPRSWDAMGMGKREVVVIATNNVGVSRELTPLVQERLPGIARVIALPGPDGLDEFAELGMLPVDVKAPRGEEQIIEMVFQALGRERKLPVNELTEEDRELEFA
ncbi:glutathione-regulated potassium-efflux system protein KefC [Erythrobacter sp. Dej080120_24]|uniref:cation:proton antiporter domain-containing protein n=1 Tax=unclassified Erythrobacter TaxID=2633097 RepID=UPI0029243892|nr:glutathione-regulated potassium-efflux system protein KefC [Erythrobacter sp. Dej080120_24]